MRKRRLRRRGASVVRCNDEKLPRSRVKEGKEGARVEETGKGGTARKRKRARGTTKFKGKRERGTKNGTEEERRKAEGKKERKRRETGRERDW